MVVVPSSLIVKSPSSAILPIAFLKSLSDSTISKDTSLSSSAMKSVTTSAYKTAKSVPASCLRLEITFLVLNFRGSPPKNPSEE